MSTMLENIRKELAKENKRSESRTASNPDVVFPFWDIPVDSEAVVRFLPDGDESNMFFWVEKQVIKMPFTGVVNTEEDHGDSITVQVPCNEAYYDQTDRYGKCPIINEVRKWFKDAKMTQNTELENLAHTYWIKKSYVYHGFVRQDPTTGAKPENPIRRFQINKTIHGIIKKSLMNPKLQHIPTDYENGRDFSISKTKRGEFNNYGESQWDLYESPLTDAEKAAIDQYGLPSLADAIPAQPTDEKLQVIVEMFKESLEGAPWDANKWADHYRPFGVKLKGEGSTEADGEGGEESAEAESKPNPVPDVKTEPVNAPEETPVVTQHEKLPEEPKGDDSMLDIIAKATADAAKANKTKKVVESVESEVNTEAQQKAIDAAGDVLKNVNAVKKPSLFD